MCDNFDIVLLYIIVYFGPFAAFDADVLGHKSTFLKSLRQDEPDVVDVFSSISMLLLTLNFRYDVDRSVRVSKRMYIVHSYINEVFFIAFKI